MGFNSSTIYLCCASHLTIHWLVATGHKSTNSLYYIYKQMDTTAIPLRGSLLPGCGIVIPSVNLLLYIFFIKPYFNLVAVLIVLGVIHQIRSCKNWLFGHPPFSNIVRLESTPPPPSETFVSHVKTSKTQNIGSPPARRTGVSDLDTDSEMPKKSFLAVCLVADPVSGHPHLLTPPLIGPDVFDGWPLTYNLCL